MRFALLGIVCILLSGCECRSSLPAPAIGSSVGVQIKRDMLGVSFQNGISPLTAGQNGSETVVNGTLIGMDKDWIVLDLASKKRVWIARSAVLLIQDNP